MRHLLNTVVCTGGPHPIEHIGCGLKMGERITLPLIGRVTSVPPDAGVGVGKFLTTSTIDANCSSSLKFCVYIFL